MQLHVHRSKDEQESEAKLRPSKGKPRTQENNDNYVSDVHLNTPEGAVSVDSRVGHHHQQRSPSGDGESGTGYGRSYAESHSHFRSQQYQRKSHRGDNNDTGEYRTGGGIDKEEYEGDEQSAEHSQHSSEKKKEHLLRKPTSRKEKKHTIRSEQGNYSVANGQYLNRTDHKHKHHHQHNRNSNRRHRSESRDSSHSGSRSSRRSTSNSGGSSGSEDDEAEEPIIELLERERKYVPYYTFVLQYIDILYCTL